MGRLRLLLPFLIVAQLILGAQAASACSCGEPEVVFDNGAKGVYVIEEPGAFFIPFIGTRYTVTRVLKGPVIDSLWIETSGACPPEGDAPYIVTTVEEHETLLSLCTTMVGDQAVQGAVKVYGEGIVLGRPPGVSLLTWAFMTVTVMAAVGGLVWWRLSRRDLVNA